MGKVLLISIKPEYATKILDGSKTIELRKCTPNISEGDIVVIYCTSPVKAIIGMCKVKGLIKMSPSKLWRIYSQYLGIDKEKYLEYYDGVNMATGILLTSVCKLDQIISLKSIKQKFPRFSPPQTFRYFRKNQLFREYVDLKVA